MCRFVAYLGKDPVIMASVLDNAQNSLIHQSYEAREGRTGLNADGFGIGWYNLAISDTPATFRSVQPAWNDQNLKHLAAKIGSTCFIGHVRASTVGDVNLSNCHPFTYGRYLFVHNGTIREFDTIRRRVVNMMSDEAYESIKGQTDSEHFFALVMDSLELFPKPHGLHEWSQAFFIVLKKIVDMQSHLPRTAYSRLNIVLTDGHQMMATRYACKKHEPWQLYYARGDHLEGGAGGASLMHRSKHKDARAVLIASEPLSDDPSEWHEVPTNTMLLVNRNLEISFKPILV